MSRDTLPATLQGRLDEFLNRLTLAALAVGRREVVRRHGDSYMACCPAHDDKNPSLSVTIEGQRILLHCFAGCEPEDVANAVGYPMAAMFDDYGGEPVNQPRIAWNGSGVEASAAAIGIAVEDFVPLPPNLAAFRALKYPPIQPILGPFATQQINLAYAPTGAGKTMFGLQLAWSMAEGRELAGWRPEGPGRRVLYVDAEMAARMMQERLDGVTSDRLYVANLPGWWAEQGKEPLNLTLQACQDVVNVWIDALEIDVVILDNFMSLAWKDGISFSSDEIWTPFRRWLTGLRASGICTLIVDHANASGKLFGTKTKTHIMDLILNLEPSEDGNEGDEDELEDPFQFADPGRWVVIQCEKNRGYSDSDPRVESREVRFSKIGSDWAVRDSVDPMVRDARAMKENGMTIRDIAKDLGVSYSKIQRALAP